MKAEEYSNAYREGYDRGYYEGYKRAKEGYDIKFPEIRWTDKVSLDSDGNIRDFYGTIIGTRGAEMEADDEQ